MSTIVLKKPHDVSCGAAMPTLTELVNTGQRRYSGQEIPDGNFFIFHFDLSGGAFFAYFAGYPSKSNIVMIDLSHVKSKMGLTSFFLTPLLSAKNTFLRMFRLFATKITTNNFYFPLLYYPRHNLPPV